MLSSGLTVQIWKMHVVYVCGPIPSLTVQSTWALLRSGEPIHYWTRIFQHVCITGFTRLQFKQLQGLTNTRRCSLMVQILHPVVHSLCLTKILLLRIVVAHCTDACKYINNYWKDVHAICCKHSRSFFCCCCFAFCPLNVTLPYAIFCFCAPFRSANANVDVLVCQ